MDNSVDYDITQRMLDKLALRYEETRDPSLVTKMAELEGHLLTVLQTRESGPSLPSHLYDLR